MTEDRTHNGLEEVRVPSVPTSAYVMVAIVVLLLTIMLVGGALWINGESGRDTHEQEVVDRQGCIARLNSDVLIAFGEAFGTPTAPSGDRMAAVRNIKVKADVLGHADDLCTPTLNTTKLDRITARAIARAGGG